MAFFAHFRSTMIAVCRTCSVKSKGAASVRMVWASTRDRASTLLARSASRLLSLLMICRYSRCSSAGISSSSSSRSAKPPNEVMGVLSSWEKLLTKSRRSRSVPPNSSAALLNAAANSRNSSGRIQPLHSMRTSKSPAASRCMVDTIPWTGFRITWRITTTVLIPNMMLTQ